MMSDHDLRVRTLASVEAELAEAEAVIAKAQHLRVVRDALRAVIEAEQITELQEIAADTAPDEPSEDEPTITMPAGLKERIRTVLDDAERTISMDEIMTELRRRGWLTGAKNSVYEAARRLEADDDEVLRPSRGWYVLRKYAPLAVLSAPPEEGERKVSDSVAAGSG